MNLKNIKTVVWLPTLSFWLSFQVLNWQATWLWWSLLFVLLINLLNLKFLPGINRPLWPKMLLIAVPSLFSLGALIYVSILGQDFSLQILVFLATLIIYQYWRLAYKKLSPKPIGEKLLQVFGDRSGQLAFIGVSLYVNFLAMFLLASSFLAIKFFLDLSYLLMFSLLAIVVLVLTLSAAELSGLFNEIDQRFFWLLVSLVVWQFGVSLFFLPLNYSVSGFLLALAFYAAINLTRFALSGSLKGNRLRWYIGFPLLATLILLFTAQWL
jgi:hypothetical protein